MFNDPGRKIKNLAIVCFIVDCLAAVIGGIALCCDEEIPLGLITIIGGFIVAYVSSLLLYGYGELIDKTCDIGSHTWAAIKNKPENSLIKNPSTATSTDNSVPRVPKGNEWKCTCGRIHQHYETSCICGKRKGDILSGSSSKS